VTREDWQVTSAKPKKFSRRDAVATAPRSYPKMLSIYSTHSASLEAGPSIVYPGANS
jgi:hypothetical protein